MPRLNQDNLRIAEEIIGRYPVKKSALIPLLHLAQEQDGWVTNEAMEHIAELVEVTPAEVLGTCSFYEMFKLHPVGQYQLNICHGISCHLLGAGELVDHAESVLGVKVGSTTADGAITLEAVECIAACTEAPCLQVNYRYANRVSHADFDKIVDDLLADERPDIPKHGTLARNRQHIPADRAAGAVPPTGQSAPEWFDG